MNLIQMLLPLHDNDGHPFPTHLFKQVRADLTEHFGGVTAFIRAPAVGLWQDDAKDLNRDEVVMFEVLADQLDKSWWTLYRQQLETRFHQDEILIWASSVVRL